MTARKLDLIEATWLYGVEFGFRCGEKGMNLEMALDEARRVNGPTDESHCICSKGSVFVHPQCKAKEHRP